MKTTKKNRIMADLLTSINNGIYLAGDKLPSLRSLTEANDTSLYTAMNVYNDLIALGVIENRLRSGYFVLPVDHKYLDELTRKMDKSKPIQQMVEHGYDSSVFGYYVFEQYYLNAARLPSQKCFQLSGEDISSEYFGIITYDNIQRIAKTLTNEINCSGFDEAENRLALQIARWMLNYKCLLMIKYITIYDNIQRIAKTLTNEINCSGFDEAENRLALQIARWMLNYKCLLMIKYITITSNINEALLLAMRACHSEGKVIGIESPGHLGFAYCARFLSIGYREIRSDPDTGLCVEDLASAIDSGVKFSSVVLSSCNSPPTGAVMPESNKRRLIELCGKNGIPIIEYDGCGYTSTFRSYCNPLKAMDHESVIYVSDFSKVYGPNFPLGFIESGKHTKMLQFQKTLSNARVPVSEMLALSELLLTENTVRHIEKLGKDIHAVVALFKKTLAGYIPDSVSVKESPGSPFLWITLPEGGSMRSFCNLAYENNVLLAYAPLFSATLTVHRSFRVNCCAAKKPKQIIAGAEALGRIISEFLRQYPGTGR